MTYKIDFSIASSKQIESALCTRLEKIRLSKNMTQSQLAEEAGVATKTIYRAEKGEGISLDTFIRLLSALGIQKNFELLLPDPSIRPLDLIKRKNGDRKRARTKRSISNNKWTWTEVQEEKEDYEQ